MYFWQRRRSSLRAAVFLVEEAAIVFLTRVPLLVRVDSFAGGASSVAGGAFGHRMIASSAGRNCFFSSAVISSAISHASPIAVQSRRPFRIGGGLR